MPDVSLAAIPPEVGYSVGGAVAILVGVLFSGRVIGSDARTIFAASETIRKEQERRIDKLEKENIDKEKRIRDLELHQAQMTEEAKQIPVLQRENEQLKANNLALQETIRELRTK